MTTDVERLARVLYDVDRGVRGLAFGWDDLGLAECARWRELAKRSIARGVTLTAPVAPRRTPLEAAAASLPGYCPAESRPKYARAVLAAAVGALTTAQINKLAQDSSHAYACDIRAALLAALTEEGK